MLFENIQHIINKKELLSIEYNPIKIIGRKEEINNLSFEFSYLFRENPSLPNLLIYGNCGTGKSCVIRYVVSELDNAAKEKDIPLKTVYVKGSENRTKYEILRFILKSISQEETNFNKSCDIHGKLVECLAKLGVYLLIVIDEVHEIKDTELNSVLFTISRLGEDISYAKKNRESLNTPKKSSIGYVLITNDSGVYSDLHDNTKSSLTRDSLKFKRYDALEIKEILQSRISEGALYPNVLEEGVLDIISGLSLKEGEDSRYAIKLLLALAKHAEKQNSPKISVDMIEPVQTELSKNFLIDSIKELPGFYLDILAIVYLLHKKHQKINTKTVFEIYRERNDLQKVNYSRIVQIMSTLEKENVIYVSSSRKTQLRQFSIEEHATEIESILNEKNKLDSYDGCISPKEIDEILQGGLNAN